jgi:hypothetical protein
MLQFNDGTWEHRAFWGEDLVPFGAGDAANHKPMGGLPAAGQWVRLEVDAATVGLAPGAVLNGWAFTQYGGTCYWDHAGVVTRTPQAGASFDSQLAWEALQRSLAGPQLPQPVLDALGVADAQRTDAHRRALRDYFVENVYSGSRATFDPLHAEVAALAQQRAEAEAAIPTTMVMADMPQPRETFVLVRGQYDRRGDPVQPGVPAVLPPLSADAPLNRLGLARWLVDPAHPLTARVTVNRLWQQFFGRGIVKTAEDFGSQGEWPTHPHLLDWLAVEFVEGGWDVKHLVKLIVMSATYQQSSAVTPELLARDAENVLLARGPRFRMDAEVVRDTALAASGLLIEELGGPSVKPYQPEGIWEAVGFVGSNTREYQRQAGEALYRRSLYTFWKRTAPPPSMLTFDAPSRETCVARRARTNTPLQALALLNDEQYVEAARHLAQRLIVSGGATPQDRLAHGFRLCTARQPSERELAILTDQLQQHLAHYQGDAEAATRLLSVGESPRDAVLDPAEHAAYTMVANVLLNLDETITKE